MLRLRIATLLVGVRAGTATMAAMAVLVWPAFAQLAPPTPASTPTSRELAAQAPPIAGGLGTYHQRLARHIKDGQVDVLHAHFEERLAALARGDIHDRAVNYMFALVARAAQTDAGFFDRWVDAHPNSYIGPLARAHYHMRRTWQARGNKLASQTSEARLAEMRHWLPLVRRDAELALQREPKCVLCYALLIELSMPTRLREEARQWLNTALAIDAQTIAVPTAYFDSIDSRWGGSRDAQEAFVRMLELGGHHRPAARLRAQLMTDRIDYRSWRGAADAGPGLDAARQALAVADTFDGRYIEARALQDLGRHAEAVEAFSRIAEQSDSPAAVYENRAYSLAQLERWPEAVRDLRIAYEDFQAPWAFEMLVRLSAGNSGWKLRTRDTDAGELCRDGALRGLAIAMTCLGGMHHFGTGGVKRDLVEARQWFTRAAEAGEAQGMMDLAQMCNTGQGGPVDRPQAIGWWLAAAEAGHAQAQAKLDAELTAWERFRHIHWPAIRDHTRGWLRLALQLLETVFGR